MQCLPDKPGVYLMRDEEQRILYVGKAKSLKNRVSSYFQASAAHSQKIKLLLEHVASIEYIETKSEVEALLLESQKIQELQPKYNSRQKDDKSYPYVVISKEAFPKVTIARAGECSPASEFKYYGPHVDAGGLRACFQLLQKIFKFRTCDLKIPQGVPKKFRPCLLAAIGYCSAPCAARIGEEAYAREIALLERFLTGNHGEMIENLRRQMLRASGQLQFEEAARLRDQIQLMETLDHRPLAVDFAQGELIKISPHSSLEALQQLLRLAQIPKIIEGVDISHHGGREAVGALVTFSDGIPCPEGYRRYKIQGSNTEDDCAMLAEILHRRFCNQDKDRRIPDLLLVDGGKSQLRAVVRELRDCGIELRAIIALAKKEEEIYVPGKRKPLNVPKNSLVHRLLCHVRDEAHRFAQSYHHHLKRKKIQEKQLFPKHS